MKYLGLDYGSKRIGTALSNAEGTIAFPRETLKNDAHTTSAILDLISREHVEAVVMGDTRALSGAANRITEEMEAFAKQVHEKSGLPVHFAREAGSSIAVSAHTRGHDDAAAAAFILQRYIDMRPDRVE
jgi:putative Holliday junction resolvase